MACTGPGRPRDFAKLCGFCAGPPGLAGQQVGCHRVVYSTALARRLGGVMPAGAGPVVAACRSVLARPPAGSACERRKIKLLPRSCGIRPSSAKRCRETTRYQTTGVVLHRFRPRFRPSAGRPERRRDTLPGAMIELRRVDPACHRDQIARGRPTDDGRRTIDDDRPAPSKEPRCEACVKTEQRSDDDDALAVQTSGDEGRTGRTQLVRFACGPLPGCTHVQIASAWNRVPVDGGCFGALGNQLAVSALSARRRT